VAGVRFQTSYPILFFVSCGTLLSHSPGWFPVTLYCKPKKSNNIPSRFQKTKTLRNLCLECYYILPRNVGLMCEKRLESKQAIKIQCCTGVGVWQRQGEGEIGELWYAVLTGQRKRSEFLETCRQLGNIAVVPTFATVCRYCADNSGVCRWAKCNDVSEQTATPIISAD
jgi:hypothetical protein